MALRMLLPLLSTMSVLLSVQAASTRGRIGGRIISNSDNSVTLKASVHGALPSDSYVWTLPDGTLLPYGTSSGGFSASHLSSKNHEVIDLSLHLADGYTSNAQTIVLRFTSGNRWTASYTYRLSAAVQGGSVDGEIISNDDGSVTLVATLQDGTPAADSIVWTLPDGTAISTGETHNGFTAVASANTPGIIMYELKLRDGYTSFEQNIGFRAASGSIWNASHSYTLFARVTPVTTTVPPSGRTEGTSVTNNDGSITLTADVVGGHTGDSYVWTLPDGTTLLPGNSHQTFVASTASVISGGVRLTLTLTHGHSSSIQNIGFRADAANWFATLSYTIPAEVPAVVSAAISVNGTFTFNHDNSITLNAEVSGGTLDDSFVWTLPNGSTLLPGVTSGSFKATTASTSAKGVILSLTLKHGRTSSDQTVSFRAVNAGGWSATYTYTIFGFQ